MVSQHWGCGVREQHQLQELKVAAVKQAAVKAVAVWNVLDHVSKGILVLCNSNHSMNFHWIDRFPKGSPNIIPNSWVFVND